MEEEKAIGKTSRLLRLGGYLIAGGAIVGFSAGAYLLLNSGLFSFLIRIGQFEATSYFLSVFIPSFAILIIAGYLFTTTLGLKRTDLTSVASLCALSLLSMVLSALSLFYFISFFGGLLTLTVLIKAYTKPSFRIFSERVAFFMVEVGAMFVASSSILFLSMWLLSNVFQTYAVGLYSGSFVSPYALLMVGVLSFLMFFVISLWGSRGSNAGLNGAVGLTISILLYLFVVQNRYPLLNAPAYIGMLLLVSGFISSLAGELLYVRLFFRPEAPTSILTSSLLEEGEFCPNCGTHRTTVAQKTCHHCGRSLSWTPYAPYCSSCGRLVPTEAQACPHCKDDIENKRVYFYMRDSTEQVLVSKLVKQSAKKKSWIEKRLPRIFDGLQSVGRGVGRVTRLFHAINDRLSLSLKQTVFIIILTYVFGFVAFISYVRTANTSRPDIGAIMIHYYGLPLEWLEVKSAFWSRSIHYTYQIDILWATLAVDVLLYFSLAFAIVYGIARLRR